MMSQYEFAVIASGLDPNADDFESRFYDGGCDDATVSFQKGHIIVDFAREANSIEDAIESAIENVRALGATVDRIEPDPLVSLSEIAARAGLTRAAITLYAKGRRGKADFPAPVARVTSDSPLWDWGAVAQWFYRMGRIKPEEFIEARAITIANEAIELDAPIKERLREGLEKCRSGL
ncbi:MAG: hypothetical protein KF914_17425 [Rhizobiaceae bacterium]|nr:hypothetical protein [Rhizobiaceae bacterium]